MLIGGVALCILFAGCFIVSGGAEGVGLCINLFFFGSSVGVILLTGTMTSLGVLMEWWQHTGALTLTLPMARWNVLLGKILAVLSYVMVISAGMFFFLYRLIAHRVETPYVIKAIEQGGLMVRMRPGTVLDVVGFISHTLYNICASDHSSNDRAHTSRGYALSHSIRWRVLGRNPHFNPADFLHDLVEPLPRSPVFGCSSTV
jgi:hypothetical protein